MSSHSQCNGNGSDIAMSLERWLCLLTHQQTAWSLLRLSLRLHHSGTEHQATAVPSNYLWTLYHMFSGAVALSRWTMMYRRRLFYGRTSTTANNVDKNDVMDHFKMGPICYRIPTGPICNPWDRTTTSNRTHLGGGRSSERKMWHGFLSAWNAGPPFTIRHCLDHSLCSTSSSFRW